MVTKKVEETSRIALALQKPDSQLTFRLTVMRRPANQDQRGVALNRQIRRGHHSWSKKIAAQNQNDVCLTGWLRANQVVAAEIQNRFPIRGEQ